MKRTVLMSVIATLVVADAARTDDGEAPFSTPGRPP